VLLAICINLGHIKSDLIALLLPGLTFGLGNGVYLHVFMGLRSIWKLVIFIAASVAASYLSVIIAFLVHVHLTLWLDAFRVRTSPIGPETYFAGGMVGAFVILLTALLVIPNQRKSWIKLLAAFCGSLVGGVLALAGDAVEGLLRSVPPHLLEFIWRAGGTDIVLIGIWQVGMGFVLSFMFWIQQNQTLVISESEQT